MKKINLRKFKFVFYIISLTGGLALGFQNFTPKIDPENLGEKMQSVTEEAVSSALNDASRDHTAQQVALNVEPDQIQKFRRKNRKPQSIVIENDNATEDVKAIESVQSAKSF